MREVKSICPKCGRESYVQADSWSGTPQGALDAACADGCARGLNESGLLMAPLGAANRPAGRGGLMPALFAAALILAPVLGVFLAQTR